MAHEPRPLPRRLVSAAPLPRGIDNLISNMPTPSTTYSLVGSLLGVSFRGPYLPTCDAVLTRPAVEFLAHLERRLDEASLAFKQVINTDRRRAPTAAEVQRVLRFAPRTYTTRSEPFWSSGRRGSGSPKCWLDCLPLLLGRRHRLSGRQRPVRSRTDLGHVATKYIISTEILGILAAGPA